VGATGLGLGLYFGLRDNNSISNKCLPPAARMAVAEYKEVFDNSYSAKLVMDGTVTEDNMNRNNTHIMIEFYNLGVEQLSTNTRL
jgi:hypothetical protein